MVRAKERLTLVGPVTLGIIVLLLYLNFRRFADVAIIMGTLPMALVGGFWLMYLLDYDLSGAVGVGFVALAGVAVEIGVVMLVYLNQAIERRQHAAERDHRAMSIEDVRHAVIDGAVLRVRPIMMTVCATIAGLLPIMFGAGTGSEVMRRIAAPMVGGMVSATLLTLIVIPALFVIWRGRAVRAVS
jgi:Cu(I)/Ag(I) efflux system membrane protein CusA/SilA